MAQSYGHRPPFIPGRKYHHRQPASPWHKKPEEPEYHTGANAAIEHLRSERELFDDCYDFFNDEAYSEYVYSEKSTFYQAKASDGVKPDGNLTSRDQGSSKHGMESSRLFSFFLY